MSSIPPCFRWLGFLCAAMVLAGCAEDLVHTSSGNQPTLGDRPSLDSTVVEDPLDDVILAATVDEPRQLRIAVTTPFCCDPNERVFEAHLDEPDATEQTGCLWDFDDGRTASGCYVTHRFTWPSEYSPKVTLTLEDGTTLVADVTVVIGAPNTEADAGVDVGAGSDDELDPSPPDSGTTATDIVQSLVVHAGEDLEVYQGTRVDLHGWVTGDPTEDVSFLWRVLTGAGVVLADPTSATLSFDASLPQTLLFELTATSGDLSATDTVSVTVLAMPFVPPVVESVQFEYLAGPQADSGPGQYEVAWHFLDALPKSGVRLSLGCCDCADFDSGTLTPNAEGVYTATAVIPDDRSAWYRVHYTLAGEEHATPAVHANEPLGGAGLPPQSTVIWGFSGDRDYPESVATALRTGLFTHVAIFSGNRFTADAIGNPRTQGTIALAQAEGLELILIRSLWQNQPDPTTELSILTDVDYYVTEIEQARQDALEIGAAYVGFDTEAYGSSELFDHFKVNMDFQEADYDAIAATIAEVVSRVGQVDFVLPAGSSRPFHPYLALANLAEQRISEGTYYDHEENIESILYPYEISGMYMNVIKENVSLPWKPYFLPGEVFRDKSYIWERKNGLFVWPREMHSQEVADLLSDSVGQCPENPDSQ